MQGQCYPFLLNMHGTGLGPGQMLKKMLPECTAVLKNALSQHTTMNAEALETSQLWTTLLR